MGCSRERSWWARRARVRLRMVTGHPSLHSVSMVRIVYTRVVCWCCNSSMWMTLLDGTIEGWYEGTMGTTLR